MSITGIFQVVEAKGKTNENPHKILERRGKLEPGKRGFIHNGNPHKISERHGKTITYEGR